MNASQVMSCKYKPVEGMCVLERHRGIHSDKAGNGADSEGDAARQGLSRAGAVRLCTNCLRVVYVVNRTVELVWSMLRGQK
jgi:hypothetical protein